MISAILSDSENQAKKLHIKSWFPLTKDCGSWSQCHIIGVEGDTICLEDPTSYSLIIILFLIIIYGFL